MPTERTNKLIFQNAKSVNLDFKPLDHIVSKGQPWGGISFNEDTITIKAGRHGSDECASYFKNFINSNNDYAIHTCGGETLPEKLNFAVKGKLIIESDEFDVCIAQGHRSSGANNWWIASPALIETDSKNKGLLKVEISAIGNYTFSLEAIAESYEANLYKNGAPNPFIDHADSSRANMGLCFSGGGSRALTCAWGQMLGLQSLNSMEKFRYISSVSGGTWASSIYSYLPTTISDETLLGTYRSPKDLTLEEVSKLTSQSFGEVPNNLGIKKLLLTILRTIVNPNHSDWKWMWAEYIAENVLSPYGLREQGSKPWNSTHSFSYNAKYASGFPAESPKSDTLFFLRTKRPLLAMNNNIMDINKPTFKFKNSVIQVPGQSTPFSTGSRGRVEDKSSIGGGMVETYGMSSELTAQFGDKSMADISLSQSYSLIDSVSTSSAFFADVAATYFYNNVSSEDKLDGLVAYLIDDIVEDVLHGILNYVKNHISSIFKTEASIKKFYKLHGMRNMEEELVENSLIGTLFRKAKKEISDIPGDAKDFVEKGRSVIEDHIDEILAEAVVSTLESTPFVGLFIIDVLSLFDSFDAFASALVPKYNYWPVTSPSQNKELPYTDGGTLENTGILGMLAQTEDPKGTAEPLKLIAFDNTDTPLVKKGENIIAADQIAPLFGLFFDVKSGDVKPFSEEEKDPKSTKFKSQSLITIFQNDKNEFDSIRTQLFENNKNKSVPAFASVDLVTVDNKLAYISAGRKVSLLYVQNCVMNSWIDAIGDAKLKDQITEGASQHDSQVINEVAHDLNVFQDFHNFPYYNTFFKIHLEPKESASLAQMWAWGVSDDASPLKKVMMDFIA